MASLYDVLRDFLAEGWELLERPEDGAILFPVAGQSGAWTTIAQARETERQAFFYSVLREHVPEDRRGEAATLLARLNWGLPLGAFELDLDDGQVRFRTSIDVGEAELTPALLKPLLIANLTLMDHHLPAILDVVGGRRGDA
jgi:hypothetical protein